MENKYTKLLEPLTFPNGATISNRVAMAPMVVKGADDDGIVSELDLAYFDKRSDVAGLIITGAAYVSQMGCGFEGQLSISKDEDIEGLKKLANVAKKDGNKVVVQLHHAGRESYYEKLGKAFAPSAIKHPVWGYVPEELTAGEIEEIIKDFGRATKRAIEAGFDGVEIHGANNYLLQQFFSTAANKRNDQWGGSLEKNMAFPLAVVREVTRVVEENAKKDFIVGYRISPEEIHGDSIGYTIKESLQLIDKVAKERIDYLHVSLFIGYAAAPAGTDKSYGEQIKEVINNRLPVVIVSNVFTADDALAALEYGDIVAIGRAALMEPQFTRKIKENRAGEIRTTVAENFDDLVFPKGLTEWFTMENSPLPPLPGVEKIK